ncbi:MAG: hypothetical protein P4L61_00750 [Candidatus Pacebacteria bacterium]|nr:hypothetical protein [Candidatus Paceibacterota bacterium]
MVSALLTPNIVENAINIIRNGVVERFIKADKGRMAVCIVVVDPTVPYRYEDRDRLPVLYEEILGEQDKSKWPRGRDYSWFARKKALLS